MDDIKLALDAYNSHHRHNFSLNGKTVSNLDAVKHYLSNALRSATYDNKTDILMTMANVTSFQGDIDKAIDGYNQALVSASLQQQITLHSYLTLWHHHQGNQQHVAKHIDQLSHLTPLRAQALADVIAIIERNLNTPICYRQRPINFEPAKNTQHAIVALGYKLNSDGSIAKPLALRLEQTLKLATQSPNSLIIVTGGVETAGITEADQMKTWLVDNGVMANRMIKEDMAANTIENAQHSLAILQRNQIQHTTLVSASIHVHRSQILFETIQHSQKKTEREIQRSHIAFDHLAVNDGLSPECYPTGQTRINCYIDALRGYGLPAFQYESVSQV
ncbi:DUF218 domain-containing protein [Photobacterium lutimaris]|nr:YdcF family protein [Photobacterium lutimaris]TDR78814.1 DUF218 domain-containing protein [Photobacterium lutimaris]